MKRARIAAFALSICAGASACDNSQAERHLSPGWERMQVQARAESYGESSVFADDRAMRTPPPGTIPMNALDVQTDIPDDVPGSNTSQVHEDLDASAPTIARIPIPVDVPMIERGRESFESYCAACHGIAGDGNSVVASKMQERRPPSLHDDRIVQMSDGQIARVIRQGYGFMPPFAAELDARDRWQVVAYVRALQASQVHAAALEETK